MGHHQEGKGVTNVGVDLVFCFGGGGGGGCIVKEGGGIQSVQKGGGGGRWLYRRQALLQRVELVAPHYTGEECDTYSLEVFTMVLFPLSSSDTWPVCVKSIESWHTYIL